MIFDYISQDERSGEDTGGKSLDFSMEDFCLKIKDVISANPAMSFSDIEFPKMIEPLDKPRDISYPNSQKKIIKRRRNEGIRPVRKYEKKQVR